MRRNRVLKTSTAFARWAGKLALPQAAVALIDHIRASPPARVTRGRHSVRGVYPSTKMGLGIQFESHTAELPAIIEFEHDPGVLEFYDQPGQIKLTYLAPRGRRTGFNHIPDFFVLGQEEAGWVECKTEEELLKLSGEMPNRYMRGLNGAWTCPPGEKYAAKFGFFYRVRSSYENSPQITRNFTFLKDYFREDCPEPLAEIERSVQSAIREQQGISIAELLATVKDVTAEDVFILIARNRIYTDLRVGVLVERKTVALYSDAATATAIRLASQPAEPAVSVSAHPVVLEPLARVRMRGTLYTITDLDESLVHFLSEAGKTITIKRCDLQRMVVERCIQGVPDESAVGQFASRELRSASPQEMEVAMRRWHAIQRYIGTNVKRSRKKAVANRTIRRWIAAYNTAAQCHGHGILGLLPKSGLRGNRAAKLDTEVMKIMVEVIASEYERDTCPTLSHAYGKLLRRCEKAGLSHPSLVTFGKHVRLRPHYQQVRKRMGRRAAYALKRQYLSTDMTTPVHGDIPWDLAHIDHTQLDIELICSRTGRNLGRPWLTTMIDACSHRVLAIYVTFDAPSSISCMMVMRNCVKRHNRLPRTMVIDNGKEFSGIYFEMLLVSYDIGKKHRPPGEPRFGAISERLFGTANTQVIHNLMGNTKLTKKVRLVTKSFDPKRHAVWTLEDITALLAEYFFEVLDATGHPTLGQTPREAYERGMELGGQRRHTLIAYDTTFHVLTMPSTDSGMAHVHPKRGIHVNYLDYWSNAFLDAKIEGKSVPVRFDPWDASTTYAYVDRDWKVCRSNILTSFKDRSVDEILSASAEIRREHKLHASRRSISARKLAEFMEKAAEREEWLQRACCRLAGRAAFDRLQSGQYLGADGDAAPDNVTRFPDGDETEEPRREGTNDTVVADESFDLEFPDQES